MSFSVDDHSGTAHIFTVSSQTGYEKRALDITSTFAKKVELFEKSSPAADTIDGIARHVESARISVKELATGKTYYAQAQLVLTHHVNPIITQALLQEAVGYAVNVVLGGTDPLPATAAAKINLLSMNGSNFQ